MEIKKFRSQSINKETHPNDSELGFGKYFTDHMFLLDFKKEKDWHDARIEPYKDLRLDPAAMVLHYNQEIFDKVKLHVETWSDLLHWSDLKDDEMIWFSC